MIFDLNKNFLDVKDTGLRLCYLTLPTFELLSVLLLILFLFEIIGPASNRYEIDPLTNFCSIMLLSQVCHISFHSIILLFEISILAHDLILDSSGSHTVDSRFFDDWIVDFLGNFKALADTSTIFENHINVVLHGIEVTKVNIEVIEKV